MFIMDKQNLIAVDPFSMFPATGKSLGKDKPKNFHRFPNQLTHSSSLSNKNRMITSPDLEEDANLT